MNHTNHVIARIRGFVTWSAQSHVRCFPPSRSKTTEYILHEYAGCELRIRWAPDGNWINQDSFPLKFGKSVLLKLDLSTGWKKSGGLCWNPWDRSLINSKTWIPWHLIFRGKFTQSVFIRGKFIQLQPYDLDLYIVDTSPNLKINYVLEFICKSCDVWSKNGHHIYFTSMMNLVFSKPECGTASILEWVGLVLRTTVCASYSFTTLGPRMTCPFLNLLGSWLIGSWLQLTYLRERGKNLRKYCLIMASRMYMFKRASI